MLLFDNLTYDGLHTDQKYLLYIKNFFSVSGHFGVSMLSCFIAGVTIHSSLFAASG